MDLNFNQCLILWALVFIAALVVVRALMAVVNRLFLVIKTAREQLLGGGPGAGGKVGPMDLIMEVARPIAGAVGQKIRDAVTGGKVS